jgi:hypothetical protein
MNGCFFLVPLTLQKGWPLSVADSELCHCPHLLSDKHRLLELRVVHSLINPANWHCGKPSLKHCKSLSKPPPPSSAAGSKLSS